MLISKKDKKKLTQNLKHTFETTKYMIKLVWEDKN